MSIKTGFWVDLFIFLGFLLAFESHFTGLPIHEWFILGGAAVLIIHILIHWDWVRRAFIHSIIEPFRGH